MGYWSGLALCLTKVRSSRARCPATALIAKLNLRGGVSCMPAALLFVDVYVSS